MKPLAIDLFCGLGGWTEGFLAEGYDVVGFDIERRPYPGQFVLQDVLTLDGSLFRDAAVIVASPPCQAYSYRAMPWKRAKALPPPDNTLFEACFRIQREASEAADRHIPMVVENVKGAQKWVGRAAWHYGSFYLWGDVPALMPIAKARKVPMNFHEHEKTGKPGRSFQSAAVEHTGVKIGGARGDDWFTHHNRPEFATRMQRATKNNGGSWFAVAHNTESGHGQNPVNGVKVQTGDGKEYGGNFGWDKSVMRQGNSRSAARKHASALIAKIPFALARHIARCYRPELST